MLVSSCGSSARFLSRGLRRPLPLRGLASRSVSTSYATLDTASSSVKALPKYRTINNAYRTLIPEISAQPLHQDRAFFLSDVGAVKRQWDRWHTNLPGVKPYYAVKCNNDTILTQTLTSLSAGFDCASKAEIVQCLSQGVPAEDIIFANPIKNHADLRFAHENGVRKVTFDNEAEMLKIRSSHPSAQLVLRLLVDDSGSTMKFGTKFGIPPDHVDDLLRTAHKLKVPIIGTSFHIGSGCFDPEMYDKAIQLSRWVHDHAESLGMERMTFLDIGGGFPGGSSSMVAGTTSPPFEAFAAVIRRALRTHFGDRPELEIIAEPGRYFATQFSTLFTLVQGKRSLKSECGTTKVYQYYINDGVYGAFNNVMFDHAIITPKQIDDLLGDTLSPLGVYEPSATQSHVLPHLHASTSLLANEVQTIHTPRQNIGIRQYFTRAAPVSVYKSTFFGPTCDSMDVVRKDLDMPELEVGEWLATPEMGAYSAAASTTFNGMNRAVSYYIETEDA